MKRPFLAAALFLGALAALILATRRDLSEPQLRLIHDMVKSPASFTQTVNAVLRGGLTQQDPPAGTVPRGLSRLPYGPSAGDRARAALELKNPEPASPAVLEQGHLAYSRFCLHCHGAGGRGDGKAARASGGALSYPLSGRSTFEKPDGELFHVITFGRNNMPPHALQLPAAERWRVVRYLRELRRAETARQGQEEKK